MNLPSTTSKKSVKTKLNTQIREGEVRELRDYIEMISAPEIKRNLITLGVFFSLIAAGLMYAGHYQKTLRLQAVDSISRTLKTVRSLYAGRVEVGVGSVLEPLALANPYRPDTVKIKWGESRMLDVRNDFGGKLDVKALSNHFELHYYGVPKSYCVGLARDFAKSKMPLFVNTMAYSGDYSESSLDSACSAEVNNMIWKFR